MNRQIKNSGHERQQMLHSFHLKDKVQFRLIVFNGFGFETFDPINYIGRFNLICLLLNRLSLGQFKPETKLYNSFN